MTYFHYLYRSAIGLRIGVFPIKRIGTGGITVNTKWLNCPDLRDFASLNKPLLFQYIKKVCLLLNYNDTEYY
jgi:hypothetical protein